MDLDRNNTCLDVGSRNKISDEVRAKYKYEKSSFDIQIDSNFWHILFWRIKGIKEMELMNTELEILLKQTLIFERALHDTNNMLKKTESNVQKEINNVQLVEKTELLNKLEIINLTEQKMSEILDKALTQARSNSRAAKALNVHSKEMLDETISQLQSNPHAFHVHSDIEENTFSNTVSSFLFVNYTREWVDVSRREREKSQKIRLEMQIILKKCAVIIFQQFHRVNQSLNNQRSIQSTNSLTSLQNVQIDDLEKQLAIIRETIAPKDGNRKSEKMSKESNSIFSEEITTLKQATASLRRNQKQLEQQGKKLFHIIDNFQLNASINKNATMIDKRCFDKMYKKANSNQANQMTIENLLEKLCQLRNDLEQNFTQIRDTIKTNERDVVSILKKRSINDIVSSSTFNNSLDILSSEKGINCDFK